jgi:hypothetical protein
MKQFICENQGFDENAMMVLMDDGNHTMPDKENIMNGIRWLIEGAEVRFLFYLSHVSLCVGSSPFSFEACRFVLYHFVEAFELFQGGRFALHALLGPRNANPR